MRTRTLALMLAGTVSACSSNDPTGIRNAANDTGNAIGQAAGVMGNAIHDAGNTIVGPVVPGPYDKWVGRWLGVEGMYLDIEKAPEGGDLYTLKMQYDLDHHGTFEGRATPQGIAFTRPDGRHVLRPGDGKATGLKYLADKQDCLIVQSGEGYCRD
ncbi:hypothetical protein GCM10023219_12690 [Stakelama sediminis]|uniref:Lipoprotein n=1 Tax=Stakelama sediminis TaxID=463200 RepID=A0A840YWS8_9SPHN|nr:hypothetical protein [Stakelama sediminis]MBB5717994.1 hypothetical protein [Stakelama sediminis]